MAEPEELLLWQWQYTDQFGKRRSTRYHLTEAEALTRLRDPVKIEYTLERRPGGGAPHTSSWQKKS